MKTQFYIASLVVLGACVAGSSKANTPSWDFNSSNTALSVSTGNVQDTSNLLNLTDTIGAVSTQSNNVDVTGINIGSSTGNNAGILQLNTFSIGSQNGSHAGTASLLQGAGTSIVKTGTTISRGAGASGFLNSPGGSVLPNFSQPSGGGSNGAGGLRPDIEGGNITPEASTLLSFGGMLALGGLAIRRRVSK